MCHSAWRLVYHALSIGASYEVHTREGHTTLYCLRSSLRLVCRYSSFFVNVLLFVKAKFIHCTAGLLHEAYRAVELVSI